GPVTLGSADSRPGCEARRYDGVHADRPPAVGHRRGVHPRSRTQATTEPAEALMAETVGDFLLTRLRQWGVRRIFGYPGDGINGIMGAFPRQKEADGRIDFIQVRHEEMAAFMACAHAKFTGEVGICLATS